MTDVPARTIVRRRTVQPSAVLLVACAGAALAFVDATIVNVAFPDIRASFPGASLSEISWVLNAYNIVFAAFLLPAGRVADLLGRKRLFEGESGSSRSPRCSAPRPRASGCWSRPAWSRPSARRSSSRRRWRCAPGRAGPAAHTRRRTLERIGRARRRARASLGGVLVDLPGWRLVFLVNVPLGALALLMSRRTLVESRAPGRRTVPDLIGATELAVATALFTLAVVQGDSWGWTSPATLGSPLRLWPWRPCSCGAAAGMRRR